MFTRNIKDTFTANLLNAVSGVLGEAKKKTCSEGCECEACTPEETNEGCMPTNDMPSAKDRKTAGKLGALLKAERDAKEKKEPNGVKTEDTDMPFEKPYRKVGERKDEYGNKVKNVAKHLAKKAMKANEEVEDLDEKRGLWDNIHAKRERIKAGSGERMRKPGSEGAPTAADLKASANEAFEQIDELSKATLGSYIKKADKQAAKAGNSYSNAAARRHDFAPDTPAMAKNAKKFEKRDSGAYLARAKLAKEEVEELDETASIVAHLQKRYGDNIRKSHVRSAANDFGVDASKLAKAVRAKLGKNMLDEEVEELDELSKDTMGRYINKAATKMGSQGVIAGLKIAADEKSSKNFKDMGKREKGIKLAVNKLTKEEQDFIDSLNDADIEQIDEISKGAALKYLAANKKDDAKARETGDYDRMTKRMRGTDMAVRKYTAKPGSKSVRVPATEEVELDEGIKEKIKGAVRREKAKDLPLLQTRRDYATMKAGDEYAKGETRKGNQYMAWAERDRKKKGDPSTNPMGTYRTKTTDYTKEEVELDEARGRPKKAGAKDFTIHPRTKEKLMHDNPAHMKKIELLQKNRVLDKPKIEAGQNIMTQLQKAKTSMTGGTKIHFTHGDSTEVSGTHAARLLDKHAGMKPAEKEAFQKKIGHSHANLKSEL